MYDVIGIFSGNTETYTWTAALADTIYLEDIVFPNPVHEKGFYGLILKGAGAVNVTPQLQYRVASGDYSAVVHTIEGYTNGTTSRVELFAPANGFEGFLHLQDFWLYNPRGFRIVLTRAANTEVVWSRGIVSYS